MLEPVTLPDEIILTILDFAVADLLAACDALLDRLPAVPSQVPRSDSRRDVWRRPAPTAEPLWPDEEGQYLYPQLGRDPEMVAARRACASIVALRLVGNDFKQSFDKCLTSLISKNVDAACVFNTLWDRASAHGLFRRSPDSVIWLLKLAMEISKGLPIRYPISGLFRSMKKEHAIPLLHHLCTLDARVVLGFQKPFALQNLVAVLDPPAVVDRADDDILYPVRPVADKPAVQRPRDHLPELAKLALWAAPVEGVGACFRDMTLTDGMDRGMLIAFAPHCSRLCNTPFGRMLEIGSAHNITDFIRDSPIGLNFLDGTRKFRFKLQSLCDNTAVQQWINAQPRRCDRARFLLVADPAGHGWPRLLREFVDLRAASWGSLLNEMRFAAKRLQGPEDLEGYIQGSYLTLVLKKACDKGLELLRQELRWHLDKWGDYLSLLVKFLGYLPLEHQWRIPDWIEADIAETSRRLGSEPEALRHGLLIKLKEMLEKQGDFGGPSLHDDVDSVKASNDDFIDTLFDSEPGEEWESGSDAESESNESRQE